MLRVWDGNLTCGNRTYNYPTPDCYSSVDYRAGFCTSFLADINGAKGPNIYGQDIRDLNLLNDRIVFPGDRIPGGVATWNRNTALHPNEDYDDEGDPCYDTNNWSQTQLDDVQ
jgi:hypothetical protein